MILDSQCQNLRSPFRAVNFISLLVVVNIWIPDLCEGSEYLDNQYDRFSISIPDTASRCFSHQSCSFGTFCSPVGFLDGYYADWLPFGTCRPCSLCLCDNDAIDRTCPTHLCPRGEVSSVLFLQGSFFNGQAVSDGRVCLSTWIFEGLTFRQLSFLIDAGSYQSVVVDPLPNVQELTRTLCAELHSGAKSGVFELSSENKIMLRYNQGYDFHENNSFVMMGTLRNACPSTVLTLDPSSIPVYVERYANWVPPAGAMQAFDLVSSTLRSCNSGGDRPGYCIKPSNLDSLSPITLPLRRLDGILDRGPPTNVVRGSLVKDGWMKDASSPRNYFPNGTLCTFIMEQSALTIGLIYFRTHLFGCTEDVQPQALVQTINATTARSSTTAQRSTTIPYRSTSSKPMTTTRTSSLAAQNTTTSALRTTTASALAACQGFGDLYSFSATPMQSPFVLNCPTGSINMLNYGQNLRLQWIVDLNEPVTVWMAILYGFTTDQDFVTIDAKNLPPIYISGAESDPKSYVQVRVCLNVLNCLGAAQFYSVSSFNQTFDGPIRITFVSGTNLGRGGALFRYTVVKSGRRSRYKELPHAGIESPLINDLVRSAINNSDGGGGGCECGGMLADGCQSPFFQDGICNAAVRTWQWLAFHRQAFMNTSHFSGFIDAVAYFERFQNFQASKSLYVTAFFKIFSPNIAHYLDVIALFKGEDDDVGSCDEVRSLDSCTKRSPFSNPPTLLKQLCWAYTSALSNPWSDAHVPNPNIIPVSGSVNFCSDVTESAGPGVYYVLLYSFVLKQVIAQIDYIQDRDCRGQGVSFPCSPVLQPNPNRQFDVTGSLAVCPVMWFRNENFDCIPCPPLTFSGTLNSQSCFSCPSGKFSAYPHNGLDSCIACPDSSSNQSALDSASILQCKVNSSITAQNILRQTTSARATTSAVLITAVPRFCGDGTLVYEGGQTAIAKECDSGSPQLYSRDSISIYNVLDSPNEVRSSLQQEYRLCNRATCKLGSFFCGDGIITVLSPVYVLADCTLVRDRMVCDKSSQLRHQNSTVIVNEECDDGNFRSGDGCSAECKLEPYFRCRVSVGQSFCERTCNNGIVDTDTGEECDDGNNVNGDGCSQNCEIECGFSCRVPEVEGAVSKCETFCGDGIVAGSEECDTALVVPSWDNPNRQGCNSYCQYENGWSCSKPPSVCVTNITAPQFCSPLCGDGLIYSPEECDDVEWNLDDKSCLASCRVNRDFVCYGFACTAPRPLQARSKSDLMSSLQENDQGMAEGIIVLRDIFYTNSTMLSRSLTMFAQKYSLLPTTFTSIMSSFMNVSMIREYTSIMTQPFCAKPPSGTISASTGRFVEDLRFLANNVSCKYRILPRPTEKSDRFVVIRMKFNTLELYGESYFALSSQSSSSQVRERLCRFNAPFKTSDIISPLFLLAPVTLLLFGSAQSVRDKYVSIDRLILDVEYETVKESDTTVDKIICLSRCQCNVSCGQNCFQFQPQSSNSTSIDKSSASFAAFHGQAFKTFNPYLEPHDVALFQKQIFAFNYKSSLHGDMNLVDPYVFPTEFAQYPDGSLLVDMANEKGASSFLESLDGTWKGYCFHIFPDLPIRCDVMVHISKNTIFKHTWNCPLRGCTVGRIVHLDTNTSTGLDSSFVITYYRNGRIIWTSADGKDTYDTVTRFMIGSQRSQNLRPGQGIQILLEGATKTLMGRPKFSEGGLFEQEGNCRVLNLERYDNKYSLASSVSLPPQTEADGYLLCNQSISNALSKLQGSYECLTLVRALFMRDFWVPLNLDMYVYNSNFESENIVSYACRSSCKQMFFDEIQKSIDVCESAWKEQWSNWDTASRTFKILISSVSALYWYSLLCLSNHEGRSCADFAIPAKNLFNSSACPTLLSQSLYSAQFFVESFSCEENCSTVLRDYTIMLGCCAPTIESAGRTWLDSLSSQIVSSISFDFGDRSNPFNSSFPRNGNDLVDIYFNTGGAVKVQPSGLIGNLEKLPKLVRSASQFMTENCKGCDWPYQNQQCCNSFTCVNGNKSFAGSCSCLCPEGLQGEKCDFPGFFAQAILKFNVIATVFPGVNFSYCQVKAFYDSAASIFNVEIENLRFEPSISMNRRSNKPELSALLRIKLASCSEAQRMTQKISSLSDGSVRSRFEANGVPTPKIISIWTYCDGKRTLCGASSDQATDVTQQNVFVACTAGSLKNTSFDGVEVIGGRSMLSTQWIIPVLAFGSVCLACMLGGLVIFFRTKITRKAIRTYKTATRKGAEGLAKLSERRKKEQILSNADIVFSDNGDSCTPSECYIMHQFEPMEIEIKFMHPYSASVFKESDTAEHLEHFSRNSIRDASQIDLSHALGTSDLVDLTEFSKKNTDNFSKQYNTGSSAQGDSFQNMSLNSKDTAKATGLDSARRWEAFE